MSTEYLDSNHYETQTYSHEDEIPPEQRVEGPLDDRDNSDPDFEVMEELSATNI